MLTWFHFRTARSRASTLTRVAVNVPSTRHASTCTPIRTVVLPAQSPSIAAADLRRPPLRPPQSPVPLPQHLIGWYCTRSLPAWRAIAGQTPSSILTRLSCHFFRPPMEEDDDDDVDDFDDSDLSAILWSIDRLFGAISLDYGSRCLYAIACPFLYSHSF